MQSSPPTRAADRLPSPAESEYSLDLAALDFDSGSGTSTPLPQKQVDRVLSEDIDGPSDFTQNMEAWMRGGTMKKNTLKRGLQVMKEDKGDAKEFGIAQHDGGLLGPGQDESLPDEVHTASHHTPSNSPPKESVFDDNRAHEASDDDSSDWDPYAEAATPQPPPHKQFLQPRVDEYYSELTPGRLPPVQMAQSHDGDASDIRLESHSPSKSETSTHGRPSSETLSPVHSPVFQRSAPRNPNAQDIEDDQDVHALRMECQRLTLMYEKVSHAFNDERTLRNKENAEHEARLADAARREQDLTGMKDQAYAHKDAFRREFAELKERLQKHERDLQENRKEDERLKREHAAEVRRLNERLEHEKADRGQEGRALEQDLELARRGRDDAEENARLLREELDEYRDGNRHGIDHMQTPQISELEALSQRLMSENEKLKAAKKTVEEASSDLRSEISILRQTQEEETSRLTSDHRRAVSLAEDLQTKLKALRKQLKDQDMEHKAEIERLQNGVEGAAPSSTPELQNLRAELEEKQTIVNTAILEKDTIHDSHHNEMESRQSELNDAILERDDALDAAQALRTVLEHTKLELTDLQAVNTTLDARVSDAIRKREVYWRGRLEDVEKERKFMAKALMRQWGRAEIGVEEPRQGYAYMFSGKAAAG